MTVDAPDYVGTNTLHHGKYLLVNSGSQTINPGNTYSTGFVSFTKPGYWLFLNAEVAAAAANPFCLVDVTWRDSTTGDALDEAEWVMPAGTTAFLRTNGKGPNTGDSVRIQVTNLDTAEAVTIHAVMFETTHAIARHDWRSQMSAAWTSVSINTQVAPCSPLSGTLFQGNPSIPAGTTEFYQMALYAGQVAYNETDAGTTNLTVAIVPSQKLDTSSSAAAAYSFAGSATGAHGNLVLPRQPCLVSITNPNAGAVVCNLNIGIVEYAS